MIYGPDPVSVDTRLLALGLSWPAIERALRSGEAERRTYTENDPRGAGEYARWARHVRRMSETLRSEGWERRDDLNQPTLIHPGYEWSLIVCSGNAYTGVTYGSPSTKNPKGRSIRKAVENNDPVLWKIADLDPALTGLARTWMLLVSAREDKIFSEVSLPVEMQGDFITDWIDRILLPPVDLTEPEVPVIDDEDGDGDSSYEVSVEPK